MDDPRGARVDPPPIDYQDLYYFSAPKSTPGPKSLDEVDPELLRTYAKLGIPLIEQEILAEAARSPRGRCGALSPRSPAATPNRASGANPPVVFSSPRAAFQKPPPLP